MIEKESVAKFIDDVLNSGSVKWEKNPQTWLLFKEMDQTRSDL